MALYKGKVVHMFFLLMLFCCASHAAEDREQERTSAGFMRLSILQDVWSLRVRKNDISVIMSQPKSAALLLAMTGVAILLDQGLERLVGQSGPLCATTVLSTLQVLLFLCKKEDRRLFIARAFPTLSAFCTLKEDVESAQIQSLQSGLFLVCAFKGFQVCTGVNPWMLYGPLTLSTGIFLRDLASYSAKKEECTSVVQDAKPWTLKQDLVGRFLIRGSLCAGVTFLSAAALRFCGAPAVVTYIMDMMTPVCINAGLWVHYDTLVH